VEVGSDHDGFSGFIGEFLSLTGTFVVERPFAIVATTGVVLAAVYSLWAFQRAFTGKPQGENAKLRDVTVREVIVVAPLLALSLFLGIYPKPALDRIEPSVQKAVADLEAKTDYREPDAPAIVKSLTGAADEGGERVTGGEGGR
jgi:NADH-quinone oxidoreductase subunit M